MEKKMYLGCNKRGYQYHCWADKLSGLISTHLKVFKSYLNWDFTMGVQDYVQVTWKGCFNELFIFCHSLLWISSADNANKIIKVNFNINNLFSSYWLKDYVVTSLGCKSLDSVYGNTELPTQQCHHLKLAGLIQRKGRCQYIWSQPQEMPKERRSSICLSGFHS